MKHLVAVIGNSFLDGRVISERVYSVVQSVDGAMSKAKAIVFEWSARVEGRKDLARLSPRILQDIGLEPFQVQAEINKPFWKK
jgi:uncharacterized protein YjiS (DUF1127 family)